MNDDGTSVKNGNIRNKKGTFVCLKKMYLAKTKSLSLSTKSKKVTTSLPSVKTKGRVIGKINVKDSKSTQISENSPKIPVKTEQIHEVILNNASTIKPEVSLTLGSSRHSLSRLAKSRHSILSKSNSIKCDTIKKSEIQIVEPEKMFIQNKDIIAKSNSIKCDTIKKPANQIVEPENMFIQNKEIIVKGEKTNKKHKKIPPTKTVTVKQSRLNKWKQKIYHSKHHSCSVCGEGLTELTCKNKKCLRVFHLSCVNKNKISKSGFICPSHFCSVCKKRKVVAKCKCCVESFCSSHVKENIFKDPFGHGMLCTVHYSNKKLLTVPSTLVTPVDNVSSKNIEPGDSADPRLGSTISKALSDNHHLKVNTEKIDYKDFSLTQFIEDECDRKYIQIGGFNVSHMSNVVADPGKEYSVSVNTDGDLFKPSLANVVIDIESVSALYQSTDSLQLVSIATENKYCDNYVNIQFIPDVGQTSNKWLATEP